MDGVGATYEALRKRSFEALRQRLDSMRSLAPFGINFVVNSCTLPELDAATAIATEVGASEFLLLPERSVGGKGGIDEATVEALRRWVIHYRGSVPLTISETGADGMPTCDPLSAESGLSAYAHIDAQGIMKRSSFDVCGVPIGENGLMRALTQLRSSEMEA